jgi:hypothetical protein
VQVEPVPVKVLGPGAQHAQSDGGLGHLLRLHVVVGVVGRHDVSCGADADRCVLGHGFAALRKSKSKLPGPVV